MTREIIWWPLEATEESGHVAVVTVSYNTKELTALLLWSLHRVLDWQSLGVVVVDNGSDDGSSELLAEAQDAGLCVLLANDANLHHGPALNQALSWLARRPAPLAHWVWVLDSDCLVGRPDALKHALSLAEGRDPSLIGEPGWDRWHQCDTFGLYSLLLRPTRVWRPSIRPFASGGDPVHDLLVSVARPGLTQRPSVSRPAGMSFIAAVAASPLLLRTTSARTPSTSGRPITMSLISAASQARKSSIEGSKPLFGERSER